MSSWDVRNAKARFGELLDAALKNGPQVITLHGVKTAILVPIAEWNRLYKPDARTVKQLLLSAEPMFEGLVPQRRRLKRRKPLELK